MMSMTLRAKHESFQDMIEEAVEAVEAVSPPGCMAHRRVL